MDTQTHKEKIKVAMLFLHRVECPMESIQKNKFTFLAEKETKNLFELANDTLRGWSWTAPKSGNGYNKIDFELTFENGETYKGRYDLTQEWYKDEGTLSEHIIRFLKFHIEKPHWKEEKEWKAYVDMIENHNPGFIAQCKDYLENYQLE